MIAPGAALHEMVRRPQPNPPARAPGGRVACSLPLRVCAWRPIEGPRPWTIFTAMNLDPEVMTYFVSTFYPRNLRRTPRSLHLATSPRWLSLSSPSSTARPVSTFGIVGMQTIAHLHSLTSRKPAVEIGWRLARAAHGQGHATEAARAIVQHAFNALQNTGDPSHHRHW